jgi:hypothetical protein
MVEVNVEVVVEVMAEMMAEVTVGVTVGIAKAVERRRASPSLESMISISWYLDLAARKSYIDHKHRLREMDSVARPESLWNMKELKQMPIVRASLGI